MTVCPTELKNLPVVNIDFTNKEPIVLQFTQQDGVNVTLQVIPDFVSVDSNQETIDNIFDNCSGRILARLETTVTLKFTALPFIDNDGNKVIYTVRDEHIW